MFAYILAHKNEPTEKTALCVENLYEDLLRKMRGV